MNLVPSKEGYAVLESLFEYPERIVALMKSGSHVWNPYHNVTHELQHVYWSNACMINSYEANGFLQNLALGSAFHDHNHSGGRLADVENIQRVEEFFALFGTHFSDFDEHTSYPTAYTLKLIRCTEFTDGAFPVKPTDNLQRCMRDADLMTIYSEEGRELLLGLMREMKVKLVNRRDVDAAWEKSADFLHHAEMFTPFGQALKADHLDRALAQFKEDLETEFL